MRGFEDIITYGIINNFIGKLDLEDYRVIAILILGLMINVVPRSYRYKAWECFKRKIWQSPTIITFVYDENDRSDDKMSTSYEALVDYISKNCQVKKAKEVEIWRSWSSIGGDSTSSLFRPDQMTEFLINSELQIYGRIGYETKEKGSFTNGGAINKYLVNFYLSSYKLNNHQLVDWVNNISSEYAIRKNTEISIKPVIIDVSFDFQDEHIEVEIFPYNSNVTFENSYFPGQEKFLEDLEFFDKNASFFKKKGFKRSKTILCSGPPGTGKSSLIKATMNKTKRSAVNISISNVFPLDRLAKILKGMISRSRRVDVNKVIFVIEEFESLEVTKKREFQNTIEEDKDKDKNKSTFKNKKKGEDNIGKLLTALDGIDEADGRMIFLTTNHLEVIDPALYRKGRVDYHYKVNKFSKEDIYKACQIFWEDQFNYKLSEMKDSIDGKWNASDINQLNIEANNDFGNIKKKLIQEKYL